MTSRADRGTSRSGSWRPRPLPPERILQLKLDAREGYVLSRIDGIMDVEQLIQVTGLPPTDVAAILERLVQEGAIEPGAPSPAAPAGRPPAADTPVAPDAAELTHRQFFETRLHGRPEDERAHRANGAEEPELSAFCFDPVPAVIQALLENPRTGLAHARLIAAHHRNPVGLEALASRPAFLSDREVQRLLLRNGQSPEALVRRMLTARPLPQIYESCRSPELPEQHRQTARRVLTGRFATATADERVHLILTTEGRALGTLTGVALDGQTVALLCARPPSSALLVENLARWPATPPTLIAHLLKQSLVRQAPPLKQMLSRHPNCPRFSS